MVTLLTETTKVEITPETNTGLWLSAEEAELATGWTIKPEGFCKDDICVPTPAGREAEFVRDNRVNVTAFWELMAKPVVRSPSSDVWFLGEGAQRRAADLQSLEAPDFTLPDLEGNLHSLADFRRKRVLLITWASW